MSSAGAERAARALADARARSAAGGARAHTCATSCRMGRSMPSSSEKSKVTITSSGSPAILREPHGEGAVKTIFQNDNALFAIELWQAGHKVALINA